MAAGINYTRVFVGTLAAGLTANVCDFITNSFLLAEDMHRMQQRLNLDSHVVNSSGVLVTWAVVDFIYAFLIVWTYAAMRPRLGPGPGTALIAGLVPYVATTAVLFGFQQMGVFTPDSFLKSALLSLVTTVLTSQAGAYVYQEDEN